MNNTLRGALFLDIDGVVIHDPGYLFDPSDVVFLPGVLPALLKAKNNGFFLTFISNKGGSFSKKGLDLKGLSQIDKVFTDTLTKYNISKSHFCTLYCTHYPPETCLCRKPSPYLYQKAVLKYQLDPHKSYVIGDKITDLIPGIGMGCKMGILVKRNQEFFDRKTETDKDFMYQNSLPDAISFILNRHDD